MPPLPRLRIEALAELSRQLRFQPPEAARRQLLRAESLAAQLLIDLHSGGAAARTYPEDWVVFRLTGYRTGDGSERDNSTPTMIVGEALLGDVAALVERLCIAADIRESDLEPGNSGGERWLRIDDVRARWGVSRKTLERYRRLGLVARRVRGDHGRSSLAFAESTIGEFERVSRDRLGQARRFSRIDTADRDRLVRRARRYSESLGWTLDHAAARLAERTGRGKATIRRLLQRHDRGSDQPIFIERGVLTPAQRTRIESLLNAGSEVAEIAAEVGKSRASIYRVMAERRAERLRGLDLGGPVGPTFDRDGAEEVLLAHFAIKRGPGAPGPTTLAALLADAAAQTPSASAESALTVAYGFLRYRCARWIAALPRFNPPVLAGREATSRELLVESGGIDGIETWLRWASRLKIELVRAQIPLVLRTIESQAGMGVEQMDGAEAAAIMALGIAAVSHSVDRFDPFKGGRVAGAAGPEANSRISHALRAAGQITPMPQSARVGGQSGRSGLAVRRAASRPRSDPALVLLPDWTLTVSPWQAWLEPPVGSRARHLDSREPARSVLALRFGWSDEGARPLTMTEVARELNIPITRVSMIERRALAALAAPGSRNGSSSGAKR